MTDISLVSLLQASVEKRRANKREGLEKIIALAEHKGSIKNNDVELLLHVSDATATRYLEELVKSDLLESVGPQFQPEYRPKMPQA